MELLKLDDALVFNTEIIKRGSFIRALGKSWAEPRNGLIIRADKNQLTALFLNEASTAYFKITAEDFSKGNWQIIISEDLIESYGEINLPEAG